MVAALWLGVLGCQGEDTGTPTTDSVPHTGTTITDSPTTDTAETGGDSGKTEDSGDTDETGDTGPADADGDGWFTPDDCDDQNPYTFPGAEEWCDAGDHDCDGESLEPGVCAKTQKIEAIQGPWIDGDPWGDEAYWAVFAGDLDGEPGEELLARTDYSFNDGRSRTGALAVLSRLPELPGTPITDVADHVFAQSWGGIRVWHGAGDFNGDGHDDFIALEGSAGVANIINLFLGPSSDWPAVAFTYDAASVVWEDPDPTKSESLGDYIDGQGDINGDGYAELLIEGDNDDYQNVLIMGRPETPEGGDTLLEETLNTVRDGRDYAIGPDLDGDGLDDIIGLYTGFHYISGTEIESGSAGEWRDLGSWVKYDSLVGDCGLADYSDNALLIAGDFTGDGVPDLGFHCAEDEGTDPVDGPTLYLIDGAALAASEDGSHLMDLAHGPWLMLNDDLDKNDKARPLSDIDHDGQDDLWSIGCGGNDTNGCRIYQYLSSDGPPDPYVAPASLERDYALSLTDSFNQSSSNAYITSSGDLDGDGFPELAIQHYYDKDIEVPTQSAIRIVPGWDIPWDDPLYW